MADEIREYVRAAQSAELRGDKPEAAELLVKAAHLYRGAGKAQRALAMLRHAQRLAPSREDVTQAIKQLEWLPEQPMRRALATDEALEDEMRRILAPLDEAANAPAPPGALFGAPEDGALPGRPAREIPDRGPVLADAGQDAWCSFCCKPAREVGALVAGAAGAFVCGGCVGESGKLLGVAPPAAAEVTEPEAQALRELPKGTVARLLATAQAPAPEGGTGLFELPQEAQARKDLFQLLGLGLRRLLLLGEEGAGKSALLQRLSEEGRGRLLTGATVTAHPPDDTLLLIDHLETLDAQGWNRLGLALERHPGQVVLCLRGGAPAPATWLLTEDAKVAVPSTPALREATSGRLPVEVAEQVDGVVELSRPDEQALGQLARHLLAGRGFPDDLVSELTPVLAEKAAASGRGAHELLALVRRVPQGAWRMDASAPGPAKKKPGRKGKKKASP